MQNVVLLPSFLDNPGLYPSDDFEAAKCDALMDSATDFVAIVRPYLQEKGEARKVSHDTT